MRKPWTSVSTHSDRVIGTALLGLLLACSKGPPGRDESNRETPISYFSQAESTRALCAGTDDAKLDVAMSVRLWVSSQVELAGLERYTRSAEAILGHYGLSFAQIGETRRFEHDPLIVAGRADSRLSEIASMTRPLRELVQSMEADGSLQIVFVDRIVAENHPLQATLPHASGFAFSPHYRVPEDRELLSELVGRPLDELPGPIVLLGLHELALIEPQRRFDTLAHEIGHALGLGHAGGRERLMSPIRHTHCDPGFAQSELDALRSTLGL